MHLAALQGDAVVTLAVREARHAVRVDTGKIGRMEAPHATSVGKAIMAWLPEDEIHRILTGGMKRFTDKTITEFPALIESLRVVRRNGYAIDREEFLPGVICVGAAIRDQAGTVIGAISASTPSHARERGAHRADARRDQRRHARAVRRVRRIDRWRPGGRGLSLNFWLQILLKKAVCRLR